MYKKYQVIEVWHLNAWQKRIFFRYAECGQALCLRSNLEKYFKAGMFISNDISNLSAYERHREATS